MKSTGIVRKMDRLGRVVIPKELRRVMNIEEDVDAMEIFTEGNTVILKKYEPSCLFCNETDFNMVSYKGHSVCRKCIAELEKANNE
ncbi:MAG: AbrB/MazE/SpoVT family DNA-binding domain-containing protein [Clostridia bacterium]|nr:AbrB/MazE/SpoVT family DNA-binding domain-containing protein [Clostridia bacterium]